MSASQAFEEPVKKPAAPDFSVVVCTYNGALRLPGLIKALRSQRSNCHWELVIVDNNSSDRTAAIIHQLSGKLSWRTDVPLRYCLEPKQGLAFARRRAIAETQSPLIGFLDDDTLPDSHWVEAAFEFAQRHLEAGAYGSSITGLYEVSPPPGFERIACCLAIINRGENPFQYAPDRGVLPAGAGMVVRRKAWLGQVPAVPALAGVKANSLKAKGEDVETLSYIRRAWPIWHNPAMKLRHVIPKERLERAYLKNLFWQIGLSRYPLRRLRYRRWQWPLFVGLFFANDLRKALWYSLALLWCAARSQQALKTTCGTVENCELLLYWGSLLSPFFYYRRWFAASLLAKLPAIRLPATSGLPLL